MSITNVLRFFLDFLLTGIMIEHIFLKWKCHNRLYVFILVMLTKWYRENYTITESIKEKS